MTSQHQVSVNRTTTPRSLSFDPVFNLSVCYVDRHIAAGKANKVFATGPRGSLTYGELARGTYRMAAALRGQGIKRGDRVLLLISDSPAFYFAFLGVIRLGAIAVLANTFLKASDYGYMLSDSGAKGIIAAPLALGEAVQALSHPGVDAPVRICTEGAPPAGWTAMEELLARESDDPGKAEETNSSSDCFILYSSGSTGKPKGCVHQHKDLVYLAVLYAEQILGLTENDVIFSIGKLFFAYGINNSLGFPLWSGSKVVLLEERVTAENSLAAITNNQPTIYFSVPTVLVQQVAAMERGVRADLRSLRACVVGGEPLPSALFEKWRQHSGQELIEGVGSSEVLHIYISNEIGRIKHGSVGRAVPGYDVEIRDSSGRELPRGEIGEIVVRGESVAKYYWNNPQKTAATMKGGWFHTGDTGYMSADGFVYFCGRHDDMLRVGSMWVAPSEVEAALMEHPAVLETAVVGAPDNDGLIKPKAFVVLRKAEDARAGIEQELIAFSKTKLSSYKCPRWVTVLLDLPKTATGKIQRFKLRASSQN